MKLRSESGDRVRLLRSSAVLEGEEERDDRAEAEPSARRECETMVYNGGKIEDWGRKWEANRSLS